MTDSLLITGPPASGKSRAALDRFLSIPESLLIVPTASMAEHVRSELAREGHLVRPSHVTTLGHFLDDKAPAAPSNPLLYRLIEEALSELRPAQFQSVAEDPGFRAALAGLIEEAPSDSMGDDLRPLFEFIERALESRGLALRTNRVAAAARDAGHLPAHLVFDGFFWLSPSEVQFIATLARRSRVTVTLPDWAGAAAARGGLLAEGFREQSLAGIFRNPKVDGFRAPTLERETEEIARRILDEVARGRAFREVGILLRSRDPYAPALETTLARFGIPACFHFADALIDHPAIRYMAGVMRTMLDGWDHAALLALLRMPVSGVGATPVGDRFDFELRRLLPGAGLPLREIGNVPPAVLRMAEMSDWQHDRVEAAEWASRLKTLRGLLPEPSINGSESREQIGFLRSTGLALDGFDKALEESVAAFGNSPIPLPDFWRQVETYLALELLRIPDRRRNAVHVMDVSESRQWELPVVFVCGMAEGHFPLHHGENPLLSDAALRHAGLRTAADRQNEERFLFEIATTRATGKTILSYARFNEKGEDVLPSLFLPPIPLPLSSLRVRPRPSYPKPQLPSSSIDDPGLLASLAKAHRKIATTSVERFLQCPFQFFAAKSLRLRLRPAAPRDRLDLMLQGTILHRALAEFIKMPLLGATVLEDVFADECRRARVPQTYRTEAVRLEMQRNFEPFLTDRQVSLGWPSRVEEAFELPLNPLVSITGRIDRIDVGEHDQAVVIDYKYSAGNKIREKIEENASGHLVQGGLYLLAAERCFRLKPVAVFYCGLRKEIVWDGWHLPVAGLESTGATRATLADLTETAAATAVGVFESVASGRIAPDPADTAKCDWCDFRDICRVESAGATRVAGAS